MSNQQNQSIVATVTEGLESCIIFPLKTIENIPTLGTALINYTMHPHHYISHPEILLISVTPQASQRQHLSKVRSPVTSEPVNL